MNGQEFIASLRRRLGSRTAVDLPTTDIIVEAEMIRKTLLEKAAFRPWFLQNEDSSINTVANQEYVELPTGFLGFDPEDEWSGVAVNDPNDVSADPWVPLVIDDFNVIKAYYKNGVPSDDLVSSGLLGVPEKAGLIGTRLYMRPIPDDVYNLRFRFYKTDDALTEDEEQNLWLEHASDWWLGELGLVYASQIVQNAELIPIFDDMRKAGRRRVYGETIARQESNKSRQQGDD